MLDVLTSPRSDSGAIDSSTLMPSAFGMVPVAGSVSTSIGVIVAASRTRGSAGRVRFTMIALSSGGVGLTAMAVAVDVEVLESGTSVTWAAGPAGGVAWDVLAVPCLATFFDAVCSWAS